MLSFTLDANLPLEPFPHYWENCVGSCHAYTALRQDYRVQLARAHRELGFRYVRFHGLLDDEMSVVTKSRDGKITYNFNNIDGIFDFLLGIGMKPFIELGFMPSALASGDVTCFHYHGNVTNPKDYGAWDQLITTLTAHLAARYGTDEVAQWYFEVWNEPNLRYFYAGTQEEYFELYRHTALAVKKVDGRFRVGGPATSNNAWLPEMVAFCRKSDTPLDFLSTHHYPTDDPLWNSGMSLETFIRQAKLKDGAKPEDGPDYHRGILTKMAKQAQQEAGRYPLYYTEWNTSAREADGLHDKPYAAALVAKTLIDNVGLMQTYSFWTFTDIFEEQGQLPGEFHDGFGLQTVHGVPKLTYRVFQCFHKLGAQRYPALPEQETVGCAATRVRGGLRLILYNHNVPGERIEAQEVCLKMKNFSVRRALAARMDASHANAAAAWEDMDRPEYPDAEQLAKLEAASELRWESVKTENGEIRLTLPPHGVICLNLEKQK